MKKVSKNRDVIIARRRKSAIRRAGYPSRWRDEIGKEQKMSCYYCGRKMLKNLQRGTSDREMTLDHKVPVSRGGETRRSNLVAACVKCNQEKGNKTAEEYNAGR